jgi:Fic family protein
MIYPSPELTEQELQIVGRICQIWDALHGQLPAQRRWVGILRQVMLARGIRGSNSIEGYDVELDEAAAAVAGEPPLDAETEAWRAVVGYRDAMTYVLSLADDKDFMYDESLIRSFHYMMLRYALDKGPGRWRPGSVYVVDETGKQVVYTGPDAVDVPELVHELVESLRAKDETPPMIRAAMAHLNLVMIHPFRDGNGRMGRCLQSLVLAREAAVPAPFVSIEEYLGANTEAYYKVLTEIGQGTWQPHRDARPWIRFVLTAHYQQAQQMVRRAEEAERRWNLLEAETRKLGLPDRTIPGLFNACLGFRLRNSDYREAADVSDTIASRDLARLVEADLLTPRGERRGRLYTATARLLELNRSILAERKPIEDPFKRSFGPTLGL